MANINGYNKLKKAMFRICWFSFIYLTVLDNLSCFTAIEFLQVEYGNNKASEKRRKRGNISLKKRVFGFIIVLALLASFSVVAFAITGTVTATATKKTDSVVASITTQDVLYPTAKATVEFTQNGQAKSNTSGTASGSSYATIAAYRTDSYCTVTGGKGTFSAGAGSFDVPAS
jgi:hypothetical protein